MNDIVSSTDQYFSLLFHYASNHPMSILYSFFLILFRLVPVVVMAPFFGSKNAPATIKMMFSMAVASIILPHVLLNLHTELSLNILLIGYALKELFIGFILGFLITIPFLVSQGSGSLIDHVSGSSSLQVTDPTTQIQTGPLGILFGYVLIFVFFAIGGPFIFIEAISRSFDLVPVDNFVNPAFFSLKIPFWKLMTGLITHVLSLAIQLGAPSIIGILMTDIFLGVANRLAPQVQIVFLGMSLKSFIGYGLLALAWFFIMNQLSKESLLWLKTLSQTIEELVPIK